MLLNSHWKAQVDNASKILNKSKIDYSPITCCFTPALPYPRSITPIAHSKPSGCNLSNHHMIFYIHIPFCSRRCTFCPYFVYTSSEVPNEYIDILINHIKMIINYYRLPRKFSISIGGGSPNLLSIDQLEKILDVFVDYTTQTNIEVHPECSRIRNYFKELFQIGISSVSVGLQSSDNFILKSSNRGHSSSMVHQIVSDIKETPLLLNIDIMYGGLYGETVENAYSTFLYIFETLRPDLINAYRAGFHKGVSENVRYKRQPDKYPNTRSILKITALMHQTALRYKYTYTGHAYFVRDSTPNLAKKNKRSAILAAGPGTYSFILDENNFQGFIFFAPYDMQRYYDLVSNEQQPIERMGILDDEYIARWGVIDDLKYGNYVEENIPQRVLQFLLKLSYIDLMRFTQKSFKVSDGGRCIEDLIYAAIMPRKMWKSLSEKKSQSNYTLNDSKYDWFFDPDVVLNFQNFVQQVT